MFSRFKQLFEFCKSGPINLVLCFFIFHHLGSRSLERAGRNPIILVLQLSISSWLPELRARDKWKDLVLEREHRLPAHTTAGAAERQMYAYECRVGSL